MIQQIPIVAAHAICGLLERALFARSDLIHDRINIKKAFGPRTVDGAPSFIDRGSRIWPALPSKASAISTEIICI
jgi:hypothetical protein